jgi:selenocysteine lyase/cysteine desulfurase
MPTNRREFIKQAGVGIFALPSFYKESLSMLPSAESIDEESYWAIVRDQFPLNKKRYYLNNGTMGPSPYPVINAVNHYLSETDINGSYGGWEYSHQTIASFVGANPDEIALTVNVTQGINIVCWGLDLKRGDEVVITTHEHGGNALPWLNRARIHGIIPKTFIPAATADETLARLKAAVTSKTKVIAVPHILCTQGQVLPIKAISDWAHSKGLFVFIDGAHGPGLIPTQLNELGCDAYASCCHKWMLGPKGTGFLYIKKDMMPKVSALFVGAGSDRAEWNMAATPPIMGRLSETAHQYYAGTFNNALFKGVDASIDFYDKIGKERIYNRIASLANYTQQHLLDMGNKIEMLTPTEPQSKCGIIGFRIKNVDAKVFYEKAAQQQIVVRHVHENKLNSLRVSTHIYNHFKEIDKLINLIQSVA